MLLAESSEILYAIKKATKVTELCYPWYGKDDTCIQVQVANKL